MKKNEFFNELRKKLKILKKEEVEDIIREYEDNINEKIKNGYSEDVRAEALPIEMFVEISNSL